MNKKKLTLTPWFPQGTKPARKGVYETAPRHSGFRPLYQFWDGEKWGGWNMYQHGAYNNRLSASREQEPLWRGLASNPEAS